VKKDTKKTAGSPPAPRGDRPEELYRKVQLWTEWFSDAGKRGDQELQHVLAARLVEIAESLARSLKRDARAAAKASAATVAD
jgi:hypothetical protein